MRAQGLNINYLRLYSRYLKAEIEAVRADEERSRFARSAAISLKTPKQIPLMNHANDIAGEFSEVDRILIARGVFGDTAPSIALHWANTATIDAVVRASRILERVKRARERVDHLAERCCDRFAVAKDEMVARIHFLESSLVFCEHIEVDFFIAEIKSCKQLLNSTNLPKIPFQEFCVSAGGHERTDAL